MTRPTLATGRRRSIVSRVITLVAAGFITTIGVVGWVSWSELRRLDQEVLAQRTSIARHAAGHVEGQLDGLLSALQGLAVMARPLMVEGGEGAEALAHDTYLEARLLRDVCLLDVQARVVAHDPPSAERPRGPEVDRVVREVLQTGRPQVSDLFDDEQGHPRLLLGVPVSDWQGRTIGIAAGTLDPASRRFHQLAETVRDPNLAPLFLLDSHGRVITSADDQPVGSPIPLAGRGTVASAPVANSAWAVAAGRPAQSMDQVAGSLVRRFAWLVPVSLALALLFAWGAGHSVAAPLLRLTAAAERIADGDLERPIQIQTDDEVGRLGRAFEHMRVELKSSMAEVVAARDALERRVEERTRELAAANRELHVREHVRQRLLHKVISAQEDERKRLARELHDETCQTLAALRVRLDAALGADPGEPARSQLAEARGLASRSLDEVQRLMHDLRPAVLDDLGLVAAIRWSAERQLGSRGVAVSLEVSPPDLELPPQLATALFRALQEVMTNVARHADAEHVLIQISLVNGVVEVEVEDDGQGFDPASVRPTAGDLRGLGLLGIRERVELFDGTVEFDSSPGNGTRVYIRVPLPEGSQA